VRGDTQLRLVSSASSTTRSTAATGAIRLKATFANRERKLWPGQFVNVVLTTGVTMTRRGSVRGHSDRSARSVCVCGEEDPQLRCAPSLSGDRRT